MKVKQISLEETTEAISNFIEELRTRPTTNISILSKYDILLNGLRASPENEKTPFIDCELPFSISLYPHHLKNIKGSIQEIIDSYLLTSYVNGTFQGIIMSYKNFKVPEKTKTSFDSGILTIRLKLNCIVFRPVINTYLIATVCQKSFDHIALLVYGIFNVKVSTDLVRERLSPKLQIDVLARFKIRGMNFNHNPPIIEGEMNDSHCKILKVE
ncbi:hypothetical protein EHI8A_077400 [Entamoeba histolytica HM-1:IMSS-B]|uniref:Uncharacterized protein n=6 Tax=Entamoeba histolytica TaxID=5759 RepID=B1N352_ENTH1|nr:hypothetical protein EHI_124360 [Entamoeba histolytica HM-1:IMSS]EMD42552.1 Hypothetical protein EHI5A_030720 [Entamoeba histolytica KU27]EMH73063.1 hypothetical protein EHI8A_077400 [Entamoeba histolytica HM-1:IMSS-B]EMS16040.1 hypothetical protein KM1_037410 [Entamoeba histolytica HM-3:IMSS]ENY60621.1 hypothetical protein EHI7A_073310 [Entamoeba histolytica HM-1:IMSS-A]GAT94266.1 hypothetical protein CL6EHI_124360 [Entamoeba histolytica]|eukprot:XP_001913618.1 hypothetical protein EHI_124360 [Entamoeba histolytica HM-1:IMSS]